ncbi:Lrp/AsnC family transcriptional regulator, partial [Algoriphagus jejuensis]|uniref:Lrp/AsnC family transcriptional regulator n=1 Tax=Algoriphagus jejuensis TaxID=419934 RepID=UPI0031E488DD
MADTLDLKILTELRQNSRASFAELGRTVGLSPSSVRERIQRMEISGLIKKYSIEIDYAHLRFMHWTIPSFWSIQKVSKFFWLRGK